MRFLILFMKLMPLKKVILAKGTQYQGRGKERQKVEFQATEMALYASFDMIGRY
jgi:hypothetical protein